MLGVQHVPLVAVQRTMDVAVGEELFLQPHGPRHAEGGEAFGGDPEIGLEDPLELEERLVVKADVRSEEHTSELQSRVDLVCRLLLEKKKKHTKLLNIRTT